MNKQRSEEIRNWYESDGFMPTLPTHPEFRHYRVRNERGVWRKVKGSIKTPGDLKTWINRLHGIDIYYSSAKWLNPKNISTQKGTGTYLVADNLLLGSDLVFDFDSEKPVTVEGIDAARKSALKIYTAMQKHADEYAFQYAAYTGYKGFRLSYSMNTEGMPPQAKKRFDWLAKKRKVFIVQLLKEAQLGKLPPPDTKPTLNPLGVFRVLGTAHGTTGFVSNQIPVGQLRKPAKQLLETVPFIGKERSAIPTQGEMTAAGLGEKSPRTRLLHDGKDVSDLASFPPARYAYFVTNRVLGVKRGFIPFFLYHKNTKHYMKELKKLQEKHKLGTLYLAEEGDRIIAISLKTMQRRQLQKVLNESTSRTKHDFRKYKRIFSPLSLAFDIRLQGRYAGHLSRGHLKYVRPNYKPPEGMCCGWQKIELVRGDRGGD